MAKFFVIFVFVCFVSAYAAPDYRAKSSTQSTWKKVMCDNAHVKERLEYMKNATCGEPKEVFVTLKRQGVHEEIIPSAVWIKRCKGTCSSSNGMECHPKKVQKKIIPIHIIDLKNDSEGCSTYEIEEHLECWCCPRHRCSAPQVLNPQE